MTTHAVPKLYPVTVSVDHTLAVKHAAKVAATSPAAKAAHVAKPRVMPAPTPATPRALPRASPPGTLEIEPRTSTRGVTVNAPRTVKTKAAPPAATPKAAVVAVAAEKLSIPATIELATGKLGALHKLLTATAWEKAAIVYAFTYVGTNQHDAGRGNSL